MENKRVLVSMYIDCGRQGDVEGLFVTDQESLENLYGNTAEFGEILGKHSEVSVTLREDMFEVKSEDQNFIMQVLAIIGKDLSGYNPFRYTTDEEGDSIPQFVDML